MTSQERQEFKQKRLREKQETKQKKEKLSRISKNVIEKNAVGMSKDSRWNYEQYMNELQEARMFRIKCGKEFIRDYETELIEKEMTRQIVKEEKRKRSMSTGSKFLVAILWILLIPIFGVLRAVPMAFSESSPVSECRYRTTLWSVLAPALAYVAFLQGLGEDMFSDTQTIILTFVFMVLGILILNWKAVGMLLDIPALLLKAVIVLNTALLPYNRKPESVDDKILEDHIRCTNLIKDAASVAVQALEELYYNFADEGILDHRFTIWETPETDNGEASRQEEFWSEKYGITKMDSCTKKSYQFNSERLKYGRAEDVYHTAEYLNEMRSTRYRTAPESKGNNRMGWKDPRSNNPDNINPHPYLTANI